MEKYQSKIQKYSFKEAKSLKERINTSPKMEKTMLDLLKQGYQLSDMIGSIIEGLRASKKYSKLSKKSQDLLYDAYLQIESDESSEL